MIRIAARTNIGRCRELNEDAFAITVFGSLTSIRSADSVEIDIPNSCAFAVYDGCGGAGPGDVPSDLAARSVHSSFATRPTPLTSSDVRERLHAAVDAAGRTVFRRNREDPTCRGMGTTATVAAIIDKELQIANVGDSRAYMFRRNQLTQLTRDDSLVNDLLDAGKLRPEEVSTFEHSNVITRVLGVAEGVEVSMLSVPLEEDDIVLLCTDGVSRMIDNRMIETILRRAREPIDACESLILASEAAGGHDNETVIVARYGTRT